MINGATLPRAGHPGLTEIGDRKNAAGRVAPDLGVLVHRCSRPVGGHGEVVGVALGNRPELEDVGGHGSDRVGAVEVDPAQRSDRPGRDSASTLRSGASVTSRWWDTGQRRTMTSSVAHACSRRPRPGRRREEAVAA